jgi:hypothetical protein
VGALPAVELGVRVTVKPPLLAVVRLPSLNTLLPQLSEIVRVRFGLLASATTAVEPEIVIDPGSVRTYAGVGVGVGAGVGVWAQPGIAPKSTAENSKKTNDKKARREAVPTRAELI